MKTEGKKSKAEDETIDRQFVTALSRGLAVMRCFDTNRTMLGTTEIAQLTGLPQPTVWRLCHTLQKLGYLIPSADGERLHVGMAVLGLGQYALGNIDVADLAYPDMERLAKLTGAAVSLGVHDETGILILRRAEGDGPLLMNTKAGTRLPVATSSAGWAWLAAVDEGEREAALQKAKVSYKGKWAALRQAVEKAATEYATSGFVVNEGFFHPDINAVAVPVLDSKLRPLYVITCGGPLSSGMKTQYLREDIGPRMTRVARHMTVALAARRI